MSQRSKGDNLCLEDMSLRSMNGYGKKQVKYLGGVSLSPALGGSTETSRPLGKACMCSYELVALYLRGWHAGGTPWTSVE